MTKTSSQNMRLIASVTRSSLLRPIEMAGRDKRRALECGQDRRERVADGSSVGGYTPCPAFGN